MSKNSGLYIVIEGQDGTGKSTQVEKLAEYFQKQGREAVIFEEPGGLPSADALRDIIKNKVFQLDAATNVLLFTAARRELWLKKAAPALERNAVVLAARNWWSTLAYQHFGEGFNRATIEKLTQEFLPERYISPDKSVILTLPDATREARLTGRDDNSAKDSFESRGNTFQRNVNRGYEQLAQDLRIPVIDAGGTIDQVSERIRIALHNNVD
jgi:dTMP kinase